MYNPKNSFLCVLLSVSCGIHSSMFIWTEVSPRGQCTMAFKKYGMIPSVFNALNAMVIFIIPFLIITIFYYKLWRAIQHSKNIGASKLSAVNNARRRRTTRIIIFLVVFFAMCYFPRHVVIIMLSTVDIRSSLWRNLYLASMYVSLLMCINSALNPIFYSMSGTGFKKHLPGFKENSNESSGATVKVKSNVSCISDTDMKTGTTSSK